MNCELITREGNEFKCEVRAIYIEVDGKRFEIRQSQDGNGIVIYRVDIDIDCEGITVKPMASNCIKI